MAINNIQSMNDIFNTHDTKKWTKSADIEGAISLNDFELDPTTRADSKLTFSEMLSNQILDVNNLQKEADSAIQKLVSGKSNNIQETMLAVEKAEIAFKTMNQVRNKVIEAYKEVMRMQI
ncbi:flagellar hook-basal body complex protein FliE [Bacteriovorax sp. Seq25_V]|uniref:flagellar hook-basal body complex protein FliE n=1 Tax=Bacteriovorax sp. Seq25_V TaxID=1201288 RepID=UPI00038A2D82|nr:flagellar hook-basal body complex protein FliE [Bacteriovorax sp. Seq25_V]EQC44659.1 flagellar hook-basal body complex protein FliE [Bacteriovorax sp. Seq25_V]